MSGSGTTASSSPKAGLGSTGTDKPASLFKRFRRGNAKDNSPKGGKNNKATQVLEAQNDTHHTPESFTPVAKSTDLPRHDASKPNTSSPADLLSLPVPSAVTENHPSTNLPLISPSTIAENVPLPMGNSSNPDSSTASNTPLLQIQSTAPALSGDEKLFPIHELWNQAYEELKMEERELMANYESLICSEMLTSGPPTISISCFKLERQKQFAKVLRKKIKDVKREAWQFKFSGRVIPEEDLAQPAAAVISRVDNYIATSLISDPYASIAWSGVSLLLMLALNPSEHAASLVKFLSDISSLLARSKMREDLHERRSKNIPESSDASVLLASSIRYRVSLKSLYFQILKFQATWICLLSEKKDSRLVLDLTNFDDWKSALNDIQGCETTFVGFYNSWCDLKCEEELKALRAQHENTTENLNILCHDVSALQKAIQDKQNDRRRCELLDWLSDVDPSVNFNSAIEKHEEHTGNWLLKGNEMFEKWQRDSNSLLWLNGKAGSGKSILCASAVKYLRESCDPNAELALAHYYFSFSDAKKQNTVSMLSSIIKQLCLRRPDTPELVESLFQYKIKGERPDIRALEDILLATMYGFSQVFVFLDALDECPIGNDERARLLGSLLRIRKSAPKTLHFFLTSRREFDIEAELEAFSSSPGLLTITDINLTNVQLAVERDIGLHIDQTFERMPFRSWSTTLKEEAKSTLIKNAEGMFQYVFCQFDSLKIHRSASKIRQALRDLPHGLDETYERILKAIDPNYRKQVASILKWLTYSLRPLTLDEVAEIFILDEDNLVPFHEDDRIDPVEAVLSYLPGLVVKVPVTITDFMSVRDGQRVTEIRFAHFSIQEYLSSERALETQSFFSTRNQNSSHLHIANSCMAYHLHLSDTILATPDAVIRFHLWEYAAQKGFEHLERVPRVAWTSLAVDRATSKFSSQSQALLNFVRIKGNQYDFLLEQLGSPLYYASNIGLFHFASHLIENGADVNLEGGVYGTALQAAAAFGHLEIVQLLLDHNANVNLEGGPYSTALKAAANRGKLEIVQLLLNNNANVNLEGGHYGTALQAAAFSRSQEIVQLLLNHNANVNLEGGYFGTALQVAAYSGKLEIVRLLLEPDRGTNIKAKGGAYGNALQAAIANDRIESLKVAKLFLSRGAEVDPPGEEWEALLAGIATEYDGSAKVQRLRKFQEDPERYIERRLLERQIRLPPSYGWEIDDYEDEIEGDCEDLGEGDTEVIVEEERT